MQAGGWVTQMVGRVVATEEASADNAPEAYSVLMGVEARRVEVVSTKAV